MLSVKDVNDISKEIYYLTGTESSTFSKIPSNCPEEMSYICTTHLSSVWNKKYCKGLYTDHSLLCIWYQEYLRG